MLKQKSLGDMFKQDGLDAENMTSNDTGLEKILGENIAFNVAVNVDETLPADETYLISLFSDYAKTNNSARQHEGLLNTVETAIEAGGARGDAAKAIVNWYDHISADLADYAAEGVDAESFAEVGGALTATDSMKTAVQKNIETLNVAKNNLGREITRVLSVLFGGYSDKAAKVSAKIEAVAEKVKLAEGTPKNETVTFDGIKYVSEGTEGTQVFQALNALSESKFAETLTGVQAYLEAVTTGEGDVLEATKKLSESIRNDLSLKVAEGIDSEGFDVLSYDPEMAGTQLLVSLPKEDQLAAPKLQTKPSETKLTEMPVAEASDLIGIAESVIGATKAVSDAGTALMAGIEEALKGDVKAEHISNTMDVISFCGSLVKELVSSGTMVAEAHANYAMAAVNNLGEKQEEAPAPAPSEEASGEPTETDTPAEPAAEGDAPAEPAVEGDEPTAEGDAPAEPTQEPAAEGEEPTQEPAAEGDVPAEPAQEPVAEGDAPAEPTQEPAVEGDAPAEPAQEPVAEGDAPAEPVQEPAQEPAAEGDAPAEPAQEPAAEGDAPAEENTDEPAVDPEATGDEPSAEGDTPAEPEVDADKLDSEAFQEYEMTRESFNMFEPAKRAIED